MTLQTTPNCLRYAEKRPATPQSAYWLGMKLHCSGLLWMDMHKGETGWYRFDADSLNQTESPLAPLWQMYANVGKEYLNASDAKARESAQFKAYARVLGAVEDDQEVPSLRRKASGNTAVCLLARDDASLQWSALDGHA